MKSGLGGKLMHPSIAFPYTPSCLTLQDGPVMQHLLIVHFDLDFFGDPEMVDTLHLQSFFGYNVSHSAKPGIQISY